MVDNKALTEYYFNTKDEFPLEFVLDAENPRKWIAQTKDNEWYIGRFTLHEQFITVSLSVLGTTIAYHLDARCEQYGFEYDFDKPKDVLCAFVDVAYQVFLEERKFLDEYIKCFEG